MPGFENQYSGNKDHSSSSSRDKITYQKLKDNQYAPTTSNVRRVQDGSYTTSHPTRTYNTTTNGTVRTVQPTTTTTGSYRNIQPTTTTEGYRTVHPTTTTEGYRTVQPTTTTGTVRTVQPTTTTETRTGMVNDEERNMIAESMAKIALLTMENNRLKMKWVEAQKILAEHGIELS